MFDISIMRTRRGSQLVIEELSLINALDFQEDLDVLDDVKGICTELHYLINCLIDQHKILSTLTVITVTVKTIRAILASRAMDMKTEVKRIKKRAEIETLSSES
ncbi:MAG: hypothetical protein MJE68_04600 [Proteobacteria bacterium]|nr:hypothetical protein [Pseudomonadota bacterium]